MIKSKFWEQLTAPSSQNKDQGFQIPKAGKT